MIRTLAKNWWLLAICGALDATISAIYLIMQGTNGPVLADSWNGTVSLVGELAMAAGVCAILAAIWRSGTGRSWALALNGLALATLGYIQYGLTRFPISILTVAVLIVVMTVSFGILTLAVARGLRGRLHRADSWFLGAAGIVSAAFVFPPVAFGLRWIPLAPGSHPDFIWLGSYFAFAAICTMALGVRLHRQQLTIGT
jgi:uncharacterized membrane protein HdeD (DUF308 family)